MGKFGNPIFVAVAAAISLSACKESRDVLSYNAIVPAGALSQSYLNLTDFSSFEAAATSVRNSSRFQAQNFVWPGTSSRHFSFNTANVEYAHAVGLTGAGETISIIDSGFLQSHTELSGKAITTPAGHAPGVSDHGTAVAAIAASSSATGNIMGVAPDAGLQLGSFSTFAGMTAATNQARSMGAIVQNNSWGYEIDATSANYDSAFGSSGGQNYISALRQFANNGVIVFAASNDQSRTRIDLVGGLPELVPSLEMSFITAVNARPSFNGSGDITGARLLSSACHEAARYCMAADGSVYSATDTGNNDYLYWSGTSFAAPQISGAVALLAQAFPGLSAQELRARLLASADNSFFAHTGYVKFAPGVKHGFNNTFGHGFLDIAAALLPIGGHYMRTSNGNSVSITNPVVVSSGASGNALSRGLARHGIVFNDAMGTQFDGSAEALSAFGVPVSDPADFMSDRLIAASEAGAIGNGFADYLGGQDFRMPLNAATELAVLMPVEGDPGGDLGVEFTSRGENGLSLSLTGLFENQGFVGIAAGEGQPGLSGLQGAAGLDWSVPMGSGVELALGARVGMAVPMGGNQVVGFSTARFNEVGMRLSAADIGRSGDRLSLRVGLPQAVTGGEATFALPVAMSAGGAKIRSVGVDMAPSARQIDLSMDYTVPLGDRTELILSAAHSENVGHVADQRSTSAGIGWRISF